jgi:hypothetical protein
MPYPFCYSHLTCLLFVITCNDNIILQINSFVKYTNCLIKNLKERVSLPQKRNLIEIMVKKGLLWKKNEGGRNEVNDGREEEVDGNSGREVSEGGEEGEGEDT